MDYITHKCINCTHTMCIAAVMYVLAHMPTFHLKYDIFLYLEYKAIYKLILNMNYILPHRLTFF